MKDHIDFAAKRQKNRVSVSDVTRNLPHPRVGCFTPKEGIEKDNLANWPAAESAAIQDLLTKLRAQKAAATGDDDFHD